MWFGVLGRLEVRRSDGASVLISGPARRQLLAALLCRAGSTVTASTLIEDLWGTAAPRTALNTMRTHVVRLRDDLGRGESDTLIRTEGDGYRLAITGDDLDATIFERLVAESSTLADPVAAIRTYDRALALWREDAYAEFGDAPFAVGERIRLAELRGLARERRTDLALATGMSADLIGDLEQRVRTEPYRERGWEQLALALYRAGRQADALGACRRARRVLAEGLGVDPGPGLRDLEAGLLRQEPRLLTVTPQQVIPAPKIDRCPYLGLAGYEEHDAVLFVGRERLTSVLASRLGDQSVVVVTGASGVGKSSLVRAGLLPALRSGALPGSAAWRIHVGTPADGIRVLDGARSPDLFVLDQAETLFTAFDAEARDALVGGLVDYLRKSDGRLLLVLRSDFFGHLADVDALTPFAEKAAVLVGPMRTDELRRALVEPAANAGLRLEPDLLETIMEDVAGQAAPLPLLSEAMLRTWQRLDRDTLTLEGYRLAGELGGALEAAAEECYSQLGDAGRRAARHLLVRMATRTASGWAGRPIARVGAGREAEQQALTALITARLVVASNEHLEVTHDALFAYWPRLRDWLAERSLAVDLLQHLDHAAAAWLSTGRRDADVYRGPRLAAAMDWRAEHPEDVSSVEEEFLDASARAADAELEASRAQTAREARGRRNLRRVALGLAATVVLALAGGAVALSERGSAQTAATRAQRAALAADARRLAALSVSAPDIATSSLLAVAGYRLQDSPDTRSALLAAVERNQSALWRIPTPQRPQRVLATPDGSRLATIDNRRDVQVFDVSSRKQIARFYAAGYQIEGMTPDDHEIVVFGPANNEDNDIGRLSVVDIDTGKRTRVLTTAGDRSGTEPVMTTGGRWLAMVTDEHHRNGVVMDVFDTKNWSAPPRRFVEQGTPVNLAAGRASVGIERADGSVEVRALPSLRITGGLGAVRGTVLQPGDPLALSPDGSHVARVQPADPRSVAIYATATSRVGGTALPTQTQGVSRLSFSPDGTDLAVGTLGGAVAIYRSTDATLAESLAGHTGAVLGLAWTGGRIPTGLYTAGLDGQLVSWSVSATPGAVTESGSDVAAADRGETFGHFVLGLTPTQGGVPESHESAYLVDLDTGRRSFWPLGLGDGDYVNQAVASFDGKRALISVETKAGLNRIEVWDLTRHVRVGLLGLPAGTAQFPNGLNAAISPDGTTAYSSLGAARVGVFDLPSGRYLRSVTVRFAQPDSARISAIPWMFDPHGRLLVSGFDPNPTSGATPASPGRVDSRPPNQRLGILDVGTHRLVAQTDLGDIDFPTALAWSRDGTRLAVGTYAGTLALYNAATLSLQVNAGVVDPGSVKTESFAPDDRTLLTAGTSGGINFYTVPDLRRLGEQLIIGNGANNGGAFAWFGDRGQVEGYAPDPTKPTTDQQRWFVFHADPVSLVSIACRLAGADMTRPQWQRFVGARPYEHVCPASH